MIFDIAACSASTCPNKNECRRYLAHTKSKELKRKFQSYKSYNCVNEKCDGFINYHHQKI